MPSPSRSARLGASIPIAAQWTQKWAPQSGEAAASATSQGVRLGRIPGSPGCAATATLGSATKSMAAAAAEIRRRDRISGP